MKTTRLRKERRWLEQYFPDQAELFHRCPVRRAMHQVSAARAQFAYGGQLTCGPDCETERRRRSRASYRLVREPVHGNVVADPNAARPSLGGSERVSLKLVTAGRDPSSVDLQRAGGDGDDRDSRRQTTLHHAVSGNQKTVLSVTVEAADVLRVRRAIFQAGSDSISILKAVPVVHNSKVRLFIGMRADALEPVKSAIMRSVKAGEFGRVVRI